MPIQLTQYTQEQAIQNAGSTKNTTVTIIDDGSKGIERCIEYACNRLDCIPEDCNEAFFGWPTVLELSDFKLEEDHGDRRSSKFALKIENHVVIAWAFKSKRNSKEWPAGQTVFLLSAALKARDKRKAAANEAY